jgi:Acyl-CoA dehydrogenase, C-terminal domain
VAPIEVTTVSDGKHLGDSTAFLQLYLAAVAGIAHGVYDDAVAYVREKARPASHSLADSASGDPFILAAVGDIAANAAAAEALVLTAAAGSMPWSTPGGRPIPMRLPSCRSRSPSLSWWRND